MADCLYGPIVIHGPATADYEADYDVDLGPVFITDWFHETAFSLWDIKTKHGAFPTNVDAEDGLINGTNTYPCEDSDDPACTGSGHRSLAIFEKGKKYRLRIINGEIDGWMKFAIDGHKLTVIAMDFVPILPYETESIILTSGQRYDVIVEADQDVGSHWMRAIYQMACDNLEIDRNDIKGIIRYEGSTNEGSPTTTQWTSITNSCGDEPYESLVPHVAKIIGTADKQEDLNAGWWYTKDFVFHWTLNTRALTTDWGRPTDLLIAQNESVFPTDYNVFEIPANQDVCRV